MQAPRVEPPSAAAAMALIFCTGVGAKPCAELPYVAFGYAPVRNSFLAFLLTAANWPIRFDLRAAWTSLCADVFTVRDLPAAVSMPRSRPEDSSLMLIPSSASFWEALRAALEDEGVITNFSEMIRPWPRRPSAR